MDDKLLREALQRRAERMRPLPGDLADRVLARTGKPLPVTPEKSRPVTPSEGRGQVNRRVWRTWAWMGNIAAMLLVGWFVFRGDRPFPLTPQGEGDAADVPSLVAGTPELVVNETVPQVLNDLKAPKTPQNITQGKPQPSVAKPAASAHALRGRARGGASAGQGESTAASEPAPTYADLQNALDEIERSALREANIQTAEALGRACGAMSPS